VIKSQTAVRTKQATIVSMSVDVTLLTEY